MKDEGVRTLVVGFAAVLMLWGAPGALAQGSPSQPASAEVVNPGFEEYRRALAAYTDGKYAEAEQAFTRIVAADRKTPETMKAHYFLARSRMKLRKWQEASSGLIRIYSIDPIFYHQWSCDFLLGEARAGMGLR